MDWKVVVREAFEGRDAPDDDVVEELAQHAADVWHAARVAGETESEARDAVEHCIALWRSEASGLRRRSYRRLHPTPPRDSGCRLENMAREARHAVRVLCRQPGHSLTAILTMALGIGATTVIASVLYAVILKPLPWPSGERLVQLSEARRGGMNRLGAILTNATYLAWRDRPTTLDGLAGWTADTATFSDGIEPERIPVASVSAEIFRLLGATPVQGTLFSAEDEAPGTEQKIILAHAFWQQRYGTRSNVLGKTVKLDGKSRRIVAVMPASFGFPDRDTRAWIPLHVPPVSDGNSKMRRLSMFHAIGRLRTGATPAQASAEGTARARNGPDPGLVAVAVFGSKEPVEVTAVSYAEARIGAVKPAILVFLGAVALLLVTATTNVANLQLARAIARRRETAIRAALGAGTKRLLGRFLLEGSILGVAGGALGVLLAAVLLRALPAWLPHDFPRLHEIAMNLGVLAFSVALAFLAGLASGVIPALYARRIELSVSLAEEGTALAGSRVRSRTAIIVGEVGIASVLLIGAILLGRSFWSLLSAPRGYDPTNVLTGTFLMPDWSYTPERRVDVITRILDRMHKVEGVRAAAFTTTLPLTRGETLGAFNMTSSRGTVQAHAAIRHVTEDYFAAMQIRVLSGRTFSPADSKGSQPVVIVNRAFADQYLESRGVGQRLPGGEVIGVVESVRHQSVTDNVQPEIYLSMSQLETGESWDMPRIVARTTGSPLLLAPTLRAVAREQDPDLVLEDVATMEDRLSASLAQPRLYSTLLGVFAFFALAVAAVGLFGVLSYSVAQRSREIGVRVALGAKPAEIVLLVLRQGLGMSLAGLSAGMILSFLLLKPLASLLHGVSAYDPWSYALVFVGLTVVSTLACIIPARRASRVDPMSVLRV